MADTDAHRFARGDLPLDVRDDRQNRQAAFQQAKSDQDYQDVNTLLVENTNLTRTIHELTEELHRHVLGDAGSRS